MMTLALPRKLAGSAPTTEPEAWRVLGLSRAGLTRFLSRAQAAVGLRGEVDVLLTGDRELRRLNREFRGHDKATDVLSFPSLGFAPSLGFTPEPDCAPGSFPAEAYSGGSGGGHAGDLAISLETAQDQAADHGHSLRDELRVLLLHGLLHLAGMDHESDNGEMAAREAALRRALRLPHGLIARAHGSAPPSRPSSRLSSGPANKTLSLRPVPATAASAAASTQSSSGSSRRRSAPGRTPAPRTTSPAAVRSAFRKRGARTRNSSMPGRRGAA